MLADKELKKEVRAYTASIYCTAFVHGPCLVKRERPNTIHQRKTNPPPEIALFGSPYAHAVKEANPPPNGKIFQLNGIAIYTFCQIMLFIYETSRRRANKSKPISVFLVICRIA